MKRVIVTGAGGFLGKYVVDTLIANGCYVYAVVREKGVFRHRYVRELCLDLAKSMSGVRAIGGIEYTSVMVHLAAKIEVPGDAKILGNNLACMISALEMAKALQVKHFVYISSLPIIGNILYTPIDEEHPVNPISPYHWSKFIGEKLLENYASFFDVVTILRIPSPLGRGMRNNVFLPQMLGKMRNGEEVEIYGHGGRVQNYLDVRDIAETIWQVIEKGVDGLYLLSGRSISNWELAFMCKNIVGTKSAIVRGRIEDPAEKERWLISSRKAENEWDFAPKYDLKDSISWLYGSI